jgi:hypothetical protein
MDTEFLKLYDHLDMINGRFDLIMTNYFYTLSDLNKDKRVLKILSAMNEKSYGGVIVVNKDIARYILHNFSNLRIKWSITAGYRDKPKDRLSYINDILSNTANIIVIPTEWNDDFDLLSNIEQPGSVEIMILDQCHKGCNFRKLHYTLTSANNYNIIPPSESQMLAENFFCQKIHKEINTNKCTLPTTECTYLSIYQLANLYHDIGIKRWKIASRNFPTAQNDLFICYLKNILANCQPSIYVEEYDRAEFLAQVKNMYNRMKNMTA